MKKIIVVGSLNMDIVLKVPHIPAPGETILATNVSLAAGGKGANQAVGIGKLGGNVCMLGRLGQDPYGQELYDSLEKNKVNTEGIVFDDDLPTGNAYICVSDKGENSIVVNPGANSALDPEQIKKYEWLFNEASYCLIQLEIPKDTVEYVLQICQEKKVKVIFNPAPAKPLKDELLKDLFLLVPNENEISILCSGSATLEEKAKELLDKNVQNIIVTLGERGCMLANKEGIQYFPAAPFEAVDTTGAGDSFIAGLAVALAEDNNLETAIKFASYVAGLTITKVGAQPSLPDRKAVNCYINI